MATSAGSFFFVGPHRLRTWTGLAGGAGLAHISGRVTESRPGNVMIRDFLIDNGPAALAAGGLLIGLVFGAAVHRTNFCTMGALSDLRTFGDRRRLDSWLLAIAVSVAGTQALSAFGAVELGKSMYAAATLNWAGAILGGLIFGYGMVFAGGCPSRNVARLGSGDLRSLVVLVIVGLVAYMAIGGILGPVRSALETATAIRLPSGQTLPTLLAGVVGWPVERLALTVGGLVAGAIALIVARRAFLSSPKHVLGGLLVGLTVVAGWALTGLAFDEMADRPVAPISLTFVRPSGDTLEWLARYTALGIPGFGVATLAGAVAGAALSALLQGRFRLAGFTDTDDTVRHLMGAAMMGVGGVLAMGCSIGQGVTGLSTLALGSFLAVPSIAAGAWYGLGALERRIEAAA
jgi:uncharacterized membrane protein YedE/YeeE